MTKIVCGCRENAKADHTRPLTPSERAIVREMARHPGEFVSSSALVCSLGYVQPGPHPELLMHSHVKNLRAKDVPIVTWRGHGYALGPMPRWRWLCEMLPRGFRACECGATYRAHTGGGSQKYPWEACQAHRGERYDQAKRELQAWRERKVVAG